LKTFRNQLLAPANIFFISAILFFLSSEKIQAYDIAVWPSFSQPAAEIVSYSGPNAIFLDDKQNPYKLNVRTRAISRLAGRFKKLQTDGKGGLWALSRNGSVYSFTDPIWKKFKTGKKIDTFSVTEKMVLCVSNGTVTIFGRLGEIYANQRLQKTEGISSIFAQNSNEFIFLTKDGKLGKITKTAESTIDRGVKDILFFTTQYFGIKKKDGQIFVYYKKQNRLERIRIEDTANILSITLNNDGYLLASNGNNIFLSPFTITELIKGEDKRVFSKKLNFIKLKATASRIFSGPKGIFRNTPTGELQVWSNSKRKFQSFPGRVVQLSVTGNQELWGLTRLGRIFHFQTGKWNQKRGVAGSISSRGRHVLIVDHKNNVKRYNWKSKKFKSIGIRAQSVYVQNQVRF